jgi:serine/threonine protein kinase
MGVCMSNSTPLAAGLTLENRYRIVRVLGYGGFGRTYLAEDLNRYNEYCVLKEFAPQVQAAEEIQKAQELFRREAGVLYKLQHPQIPRFRELLRLKVGSREYLFLVQDYVEGQTYSDLLKSRQQRPQPFTESEVVQILRDILPVLQHIHSLGVVHRDISPENLIQRSGDNLPVLIDFGAVKQAATTAIAVSSGRPIMTLLGKEGFAPQEQIQQGQAFPCTDLYSLAVTVLVLLTGKDPKRLYSSSKMTWRWRAEVNLSPGLGNILDKMLAHRPRDRYQSANDVLSALEKANLNTAPATPITPTPTTAVHSSWQAAITHTLSKMNTVNFVGRIQGRRATQMAASRSPSTQINPPFNISNDLWANLQAAFYSMVMVLLVGMGAWALVKGWNFVSSGVSNISRWQPPNVSLPLSIPSVSLPLPSNTPLGEAEQAQLNEILKRSQELGISANTFYRQVDQLFYSKYPELKGRPLSSKAEDAKYRQRWRQVASEWLEKIQNGEQ